MKVTSTIDLSDLKIHDLPNQVIADDIGLLASKDWHRITGPFTPQRTKQLVRNVEYMPWEFIYKSTYASYIYNGVLFVDPKYEKGGFTNGNTWWSRKGVKKKATSKPLKFRTNLAPYASKEFDKAAVKAGKDKDLVNSIAEHIKRKLGD